MKKELVKVYLSLAMFACLLTFVFPSLFSHLNSGLQHAAGKTLAYFAHPQNSSVNIDLDRANVIIMFDDGWKTQYTVGYKYMHSKGMVGSIAVIPSVVGDKNYINIGQLYTLYNNNWDILNHTLEHKRLSELSEEMQAHQITTAENWLINNGFSTSSKILIYPEGNSNTTTENLIKKLNYSSARYAEPGFNPQKPLDLYAIKIQNIYNTTSPETAKNWVDYAISNNLTLILLFHELDNNPGDFAMKYHPSDFYQIIDHIDANRHHLNIITYSDWIQSIVAKR